MPDDGVLDSYTDIKNSTCSFCQLACKAPDVNDDIALLDGLSWKLVGFSYLGFFVFTIIFQVIAHFCCMKKSGPAGENSGNSRFSNNAGGVNYTRDSSNISGGANSFS